MTDKIAADWAEFHRDNPHVYNLFDRFARQMALRCDVLSAKLIFERLRWEMMLDTSEDQPRLNNNYTALYARHWEKMNPDATSGFRKRVRRKNTVNSILFDDAEL